MRESYLKLLSVAYDLMTCLNSSSFEVHPFEDGAFIDIVTLSNFDPAQLLKLADGHRMSIFPDEDTIVIRVYEN